MIFEFDISRTDCTFISLQLKTNVIVLIFAVYLSSRISGGKLFSANLNTRENKNIASKLYRVRSAL